MQALKCVSYTSSGTSWTTTSLEGQGGHTSSLSRSPQDNIIQEEHAGGTSGHLEGKKSFKRLKEGFYGPGYSYDVSVVT